MEISQHIKNLLVSNERVILSNFGAFTTKQVSAKYDEATGTMKPPFKIVTFDKDVQEDAGLLSEHIAKQEGFSKEVSVEQINEYVKTVKSQLEAGKTVEFKDLGTFNQTPEGDIEFAFLSEDNLLLNSFGLPAVSVDKKEDAATPTVVAKPKTKTKVKETKVEKKKRVNKPKPKTEKRKPVKKNKDTENKKRKKWPIFAIFFLAIGLVLAALFFFKPVLWERGYNFSAEKIASVKQMFTGGNDKINYDIIDPDKDAENGDNNPEIAETDTNSNSSYENYTDEDDYVSDDDDDDDDYNYEPSEEENVIAEEASVDNEVATETEDVTPIETNTTVSSAQKGSYYIIVGSVKLEATAKKEQKRFSKKGISTSIIKAGESRYRISMGEFNSAKEAQDYYSDMQAKHGTIEAWVWEKR